MALASEKRPDEHAVHVGERFDEEKKPEAHVTQDVLPDMSEDLEPASHASHDVDMLSDEYVPPGHSRHATEPIRS